MAELRTATPEDRDLLARICSEGFYLDPVMRWAFPDDATRLAKLALIFGGMADDYFPDRGVVHVVDDASAAFWRSPDFDAVSTAASRTQQRPPDDDAPTPVTDDEMERLVLLATVMEEAHPEVPCWYLNVVSTLPSRQSQGLGTAVLRPVLERADADGVPCYLESTNPRNRTLYYRHGFEDRDELPLDGGPSMLAMWREPRG